MGYMTWYYEAGVEALLLASCTKTKMSTKGMLCGLMGTGSHGIGYLEMDGCMMLSCVRASVHVHSIWR